MAKRRRQETQRHRLGSGLTIRSDNGRGEDREEMPRRWRDANRYRDRQGRDHGGSQQSEKTRVIGIVWNPTILLGEEVGDG
jgi:hypothetical protein